MNSICIIHAGRESYYLQINQEDYYTGTHDPKGKFYGEGAKELGIEEEAIVHQDPRLKNLFKGISPDGDRLLRKGAYNTRTYTIYKDPVSGKKKTLKKAEAQELKAKDPLKFKENCCEKKFHSVVGWDNVFSAPKDVSVVWSQAPEHVRRIIFQAHIEAVKEGIKHLETAAYTRNGRNGVELEKVKATFAVFHHTTSRKEDPQLHSHVVTINTGIKENGKGGALDGRKILQARYTAGLVYQNYLRGTLERKLNIKTYDRPYENSKGTEKGVTFGIVGLSPEVLREFSKRSRQIEKGISERLREKEKHTSPSQRTSSELSDKQIRAIVLETRDEKKDHLDGRELLQQWQQRGKELGFQWQQVVSRNSTHKPITPHSLNQINREIASTLQFKQQKGGFTFSQLHNAVLKSSKGRLNTKQVNHLVQQYKTNYTRQTPDAERLRLNEAGKKLIDYSSLREKIWQTAKTVIYWHKKQLWYNKQLSYRKAQRRFTRKVLGLYITGKITRRQYLKITQNKGQPQTVFGVRAKQALGLMSKRQADYMVKKIKTKQHQYQYRRNR